VLWWGEHDAEEHMVGQEYQTSYCQILWIGVSRGLLITS